MAHHISSKINMVTYDAAHVDSDDNEASQNTACGADGKGDNAGP